MHISKALFSSAGFSLCLDDLAPLEPESLKEHLFPYVPTQTFRPSLEGLHPGAPPRLLR